MDAAAASLLSESTSLDPADWSGLRALGHRMVDDMVAHLAHVADGPVATVPLPMPAGRTALIGGGPPALGGRGGPRQITS